MAQPEKVFRIGSCSASVFLNSDGQKRSFRSVQLQRRYQDDKGEWRSASSYTLTQLLAAIRVLQLAADYLVEQETGDSEVPF